LSPPLLEVDAVSRTFVQGGLLAGRRIRAVDGVSFTLANDRPEIFSVIGESGSGKSTLARMILALLPPSEGVIRFEGRPFSALRRRRDRLAFMARVQPIFQNPFAAFNPLKRVDRYLFATARTFTGATDRETAARQVDEALRRVGLSLAEVGGRYPHELSGGQLQRVAIARALIPGPRLIVADEPVSMVDASLRMAIVNLFKMLRDELRVSIVYITHDLATAYYISDRVIVMRRGRVVESGPARTVLDAPTHPYAIELKKAVLSVDAGPAALDAALAAQEEEPSIAR
jgi:peptide/nickel transport system ATP-binding protein